MVGQKLFGGDAVGVQIKLIAEATFWFNIIAAIISAIVMVIEETMEFGFIILSLFGVLIVTIVECTLIYGFGALVDNSYRIRCAVNGEKIAYADIQGITIKAEDKQTEKVAKEVDRNKKVESFQVVNKIENTKTKEGTQDPNKAVKEQGENINPAEQKYQKANRHLKYFKGEGKLYALETAVQLYGQILGYKDSSDLFREYNDLLNQIKKDKSKDMKTIGLVVGIAIVAGVIVLMLFL